ncbi:hypothetical protein LX36DRAFT_591238, partial [Colletotrichum falcatum]
KSIRYLPFSYECFQVIAERLLVHSGISRVVSRGDVAVFSAGEVGEYSQIPSSFSDIYGVSVYHCRSSDYWSNDMALTVTHCLKSRWASAIFFGTTPEIEKQILDRLGFAQDAIHHPLLFPGIFSELERERHLKVLVKEAQNDLESNISTLSMQEENDKAPPPTDNTETLDLWFKATEIRNGLVNWKIQLKDMLTHAEYLVQRSDTESAATDGKCPRPAPQANKATRVGQMLKNRLCSIVNEYDENIRDCTMRVDGMSMATQLWHAQTNMHIALDAKRDGKRIQTISMFSVVFLPSMFVATIFSTEFFNWFPKEGQAIVSPYFWVLIVFSGCLTVVILGGYYAMSSQLLRRLTGRLKCSESMSEV